MRFGAPVWPFQSGLRLTATRSAALPRAASRRSELHSAWNRDTLSDYYTARQDGHLRVGARRRGDLQVLAVRFDAARPVASGRGRAETPPSITSAGRSRSSMALGAPIMDGVERLALRDRPGEGGPAAHGHQAAGAEFGADGARRARLGPQLPRLCRWRSVVAPRRARTRDMSATRSKPVPLRLCAQSRPPRFASSTLSARPALSSQFRSEPHLSNQRFSRTSASTSSATASITSTPPTMMASPTSTGALADGKMDWTGDVSGEDEHRL